MPFGHADKPCAASFQISVRHYSCALISHEPRLLLRLELRIRGQGCVLSASRHRTPIAVALWLAREGSANIEFGVGFGSAGNWPDRYISPGSPSSHDYALEPIEKFPQ